MEIAGRAQRFEPPAVIERTSGATFGALGRLLGYDGPVITGDTLAFNPLPAGARPQRCAAQRFSSVARCRQGPGCTARPAAGRRHIPQPAGWPGEVLADAYRFDLPPDSPSGTYTVIVKLYDATSFAPLPVTLPDGSEAGEYLRIAEVER